ncbi:MAG: hypothetical protein J5846_10260 [Desulfovibrio sp.]|nr:hypothetical protein [Desulfovibrio sp.]
MLFLVTLLHFAVDGLCGAVLAAHDQAVVPYSDIVALYALYNLIAFGGQWLAGLVLDFRPHWLLGTFPLAIFCLALAMPQGDVLLQAGLLGIGNCLFHATAGSYVLRTSQSFSEPGIFVSSGAIGLALGIYGFLSPMVFFVLCCGCLAGILWLGQRKKWSAYIEQPTMKTRQSLPLIVCLVLLLACVSLRGFGSGASSAPFVLLFPCLFTLGKALGGICCDRIGYNKTLLMIFLMSFLALQLEGLAGSMLLAVALNMTMPLTLRLAHVCFPGYPGLIFGLTAGCLLPGLFLGSLLVTLKPQVAIVCVFLGLFAAGALARRYAHFEAARL